MTKAEMYGSMITNYQTTSEKPMNSYWQGGEGHLDADVLVIGDDWNSFEGNTRETLCQLMDTIGYSLREDNEKVFCTNLMIPGGIQQDEQKVFTYIKQLVYLIEPKVVLCLGKTSFEAVFNSFGMELTSKLKKEGYNYIIDRNSVGYYLTFGKNNEKKKIRVFALARCTYMGISSRNFKGEHEDVLFWVKEDYKKVGAFLEENRVV